MESPKEILKPESLIEPLTPEEKGEFDALVEMIESAYDNAGQAKNVSKWQWQIVEKFGERAVPYILKLPKENKGIGKLNMVRFLNTLVTEKTAPLVLKSIQEGKIDICDGALAAAKGKEKTATGLADLLFEIEWPNTSGRDNHIVLLEALSLCVVDGLALKIVEFYKKLRSDNGYAKAVKNHLKNVGNDLYDCDAYDVAKALARLSGPISKRLLTELAESGDNYIKTYAQGALDRKLYISEPIKWLIERPIRKDEYYSYNSDPDLDDDDPNPRDYGDVVEGLKYKKPEQLLPTRRINFLSQFAELDEAKTAILKDYFDGKNGVFETLGGLSEEKVIKSLKDLPKGMRGEGLAAATSLELFKITRNLPDFKETKEALGAVKKKFAVWKKELAELSNKETANRAAQTSQLLIEHYEAILLSSEQGDFRLPDSALGFRLWHEGLKKERQIKPFIELFYKKSARFFLENAFDSIRSGYFLLAQDFIENIKEAFRLYHGVTTFDVPIYKNAADRLKEIAGNKSQVFYGRDADYFYYAVKATRFGLADKSRLKKIYINTQLKSELNTPDSAMKERIVAYLLQEKILADAIHIDSGLRGSVPEAVIRNLNPKLTDAEVSERIKLLESHHAGREDIGKAGGGLTDTIENRPHQYGYIQNIKRDEKTGRMKIEFREQAPWEEIKAWVVNQAIIRHLAPKKQ